MCHRFSAGLPFNYPSNGLSYPGNFLQMMWRIGDEYELDPVLERAMDVLFILHADHEQNCGTTAMRVVGSSQADPYSSAAAAASALYGPLHGGANEAVVRMLEEIGSIDNVPAFIDTVKSGADRLMGFGHRVYKNYDPRATIIKQTAYDVFEVTGKNPLLDIALKLEEAALSDSVLRRSQALPQRRLLLGPDLPGDGLPRRHVHRAVRDPAHGRMAGALAGVARRQGAEDLAPTPVVHGSRRPATTSASAIAEASGRSDAPGERPEHGADRHCGAGHDRRRRRDRTGRSRATCSAAASDRDSRTGTVDGRHGVGDRDRRDRRLADRDHDRGGGHRWLADRDLDRRRGHGGQPTATIAPSISPVGIGRVSGTSRRLVGVGDRAAQRARTGCGQGDADRHCPPHPASIALHRPPASPCTSRYERCAHRQQRDYGRVRP